MPLEADGSYAPAQPRHAGLPDDPMNTLLGYLTAVPAPLAYAVIGGLVFAEAALFFGFVIPGETAVIIGAVLAALGHLNVAVLLLLVIGAAVIGDSVGYEIGKKLGPRLTSIGPMRRHQTRAEQAMAYLHDRGGRALVLGRWTAFLRAVMPALAGASGIRYRRFLLFNVVGGVTWATIVVALAYSAGASYQALARQLSWVSSAVLALIVLAIGWHLWRHRRPRRPAT